MGAVLEPTGFSGGTRHLLSAGETSSSRPLTVVPNMLFCGREKGEPMPRTLTLTALIVASLTAGSVKMQERPNFDGAWVMDMTRSESTAQAADAAPRTPVRLHITSSPAAVN